MKTNQPSTSLKTFAVASIFFLYSLADSGVAEDKSDRSKPTQHVTKQIRGWTLEFDSRLLSKEHSELYEDSTSFLEYKLRDIERVVPEKSLAKLKSIKIVVDLSHGELTSMQYHPSPAWLESHGYSKDLAKCVHIPRATDLATKRNTNEQPWVVLHELAHAYHDQFLDFDNADVMKAFIRYKESQNGEKTLLFNGSRVKHYGLTDQKEFFAEMTEAYFGVNDFFPFTRAELKESEPQIETMLTQFWN